MLPEYEKNQLCWAKISGYPWWPAFINQVQENEVYEVIYFGEFQKSYLKKDCIRDFASRRLPKKASKAL